MTFLSATSLNSCAFFSFSTASLFSLSVFDSWFEISAFYSCAVLVWSCCSSNLFCKASMFSFYCCSCSFIPWFERAFSSSLVTYNRRLSSCDAISAYSCFYFATSKVSVWSSCTLCCFSMRSASSWLRWSLYFFRSAWRACNASSLVFSKFSVLVSWLSFPYSWSSISLSFCL